MAENKYAEILTRTACYSTISFSFLLAKETGIFKTLLNSDKPISSEDIANENKLKERYAREMLGCLSAVELVKVSTNEKGVSVYHLEKAAKDALIGNDFALPEMNFLKVLMKRYEAVRETVSIDSQKVVRYDQCFLDLLDEHKQKLSTPTIDCLLAYVPGLKERLEKGIDVIEFGCGNAYYLSVLASMFPKSSFTATEVNAEFLEPLKKRYSHISNLKYDVIDLCAIPMKVSKKYDWLYTNDVIHDLPHPTEALKGIRRMVKEPDGVYTSIDFAGTGSHHEDVGDMEAAFWYVCSTFVCIPESFQHKDSEAHGASIGKDTALRFAKDAKFHTKVITLPGKTALYIATPV